MDGPNIDISETHEDDGVRLKLVGELDLATAPTLRELFGKLRDENVPVSLDLSELEFMDSSGINALLAATKEADTDGWRLHLLPNLVPQVRRLFELTGTLAYFLGDHHGHSSTR